MAPLPVMQSELLPDFFLVMPPGRFTVRAGPCSGQVSLSHFTAGFFFA